MNHRHLHTISRELVHRTALAEVFVTELEQRADDVFASAVQLPRSHAFYTDHVGPLAGRYDPLLVMEAARQSGMAVVHQYFGVPMTRAFLLRTFNGRALNTDTWDICSVPADLEIVVGIERQFHADDGTLTGLAVRLDVSRAGTPMMIVDSKFSWIPRPEWVALRRNVRRGAGFEETVVPMTPPAAALPSDVCREVARNVVVTPPQRTGDTAAARLVTDVGHPTLFDHPVDHVPGSLQIEACRQLGAALVTERTDAPFATLECVKSRFNGFLELDQTSEITATLASSDDGRTLVRAQICQNGRSASEFDMIVRAA